MVGTADTVRVVAVAGSKGGTGKSLLAANIGIFLATLGITIMFLDLTMSGLIAGFMQRELNPWSDFLDASVPFWWVRTFSGALMIAGLLCGLYNMWMTARGRQPYVEEHHYVSAMAE